MNTPDKKRRILAALMLATLTLTGCATSAPSITDKEGNTGLNLSAAVETVTATAHAHQQERANTATTARLTAQADAYQSLRAHQEAEAARAEAQEAERQRLAAEERARQEEEELARREAQAAQAAAEERARVTELQQALVEMGYPVEVDGVLGTHTQTALNEVATQSGAPITTDKANADTLAAVQRLKDEGHKKAPPSFTTNVWTSGHQAEVDLCRGAVIIGNYQRTDASGHVSPDPVIPVIGEHNHCGGRPSLDVPVGGTITFTGLHADTYTIVDEMTVHAGQEMSVANNLRGDIFFTTCYTADTTGAMRMVGMKKVA